MTKKEMTKEEKALLDTLAYCEGTIGVSNNGYDVVAGKRRIIAGWTKDTKIVHGGTDWLDNQTKSTAAGRYQFIYDTWVGRKKINLPMTKENQDKKGLELINGSLRDIDKTKLTDKTVFYKALNKLCKIWASIPVTSDITDKDGNIHKAGKSYYASDNINKSQYSADEIYQIYKLALDEY
jgi:muramidase (phage lysozyme)